MTNHGATIVPVPTIIGAKSVGDRAQSSPQIASRSSAKAIPDGVVGQPPERPFAADRPGGRDAVVEEMPAGEMPDPAAEERVVQAPDVEGATRHQRPDVHEGRSSDADERAPDQDLGDVGHAGRSSQPGTSHR